MPGSADFGIHWGCGTHPPWIPGHTCNHLAQIMLLHAYIMRVLCCSQEKAPIKFHINFSSTKFSLNRSLIDHS